jgi:hypothetical protein
MISERIRTIIYKKILTKIKGPIRTLDFLINAEPLLVILIFKGAQAMSIFFNRKVKTKLNLRSYRKVPNFK